MGALFEAYQFSFMKNALLAVLRPEGFESVLLLTKKGMAIHFAVEDVSLIGRTAAGVKAMDLAADDEVAFAFVHNSEGEVIMISEMGCMKRCLLFEYEIQNRYGKGVRTFEFKKNGSNGTRLIGAMLTDADTNFTLVQRHGARTTLSASEVRIEPRAGKGQPVVMVLMDDVVTALVKK